MTLIPTLDTSAITKPADSARTTPPDEAALRQAAAQFESLLLTQLTASLNPKDEDEEGLFSNSGGGMGIARQMYSEQLARTMSESGGIGIAEMVVSQAIKRVSHPGETNVGERTERAVATAREIRNEPPLSFDGKTTPRVTKADRANSAVSFAEFNTTDSSAVNTATRPRRVHSIADRTDLKLASAHARPLAIPAARKSLGPTSYVRYQAPVSGEIRSRFGMRRDPINGRMRLHQGIDIAAKQGTPIAAAAAGTVVFAGKNKGYGNMVMIEHADGRRTLYAHAEKLFVKAGDVVNSGETIAAVGSTGHSTGPHLHFEIRESNRAVDPLAPRSNDFAIARR
jgi:murein DD-endopeptidase MepM/ murein hydrolase activator NlpD